MWIDRKTYLAVVSLFTSAKGFLTETEATDHARTLASSAPLLLPTASSHQAPKASASQGGSSVVSMSEWLARKSREGSKL